MNARTSGRGNHPWLVTLVGVLMAVLMGVDGCADLQTATQAVDFGEVYIGTTAVRGPVTWTNQATNPIDVVGVLIYDQSPNRAFGSRPDPFTAATVAPGANSPGITFTFTPTQEASYTGTAVPLLIDGAGGADRVQLKGKGKAQIVLGAIILNGGGTSNLRAGQVLDFGTVLVPGGQPVTRRFRVVNSSPNPIRLTPSWTVGGQGFTVTNPAGAFTVPATSRVWVTIQFAPPAVGDFTDAVTFADAAGNNKAGTAVHGIGARRQE